MPPLPDWALLLCSLGCALTALAGCYRLLAGPDHTDRILGLDLLFAVAILSCLLAAWSSGRALFLDMAIGLTLTGFVATLAWSRFIQDHSHGGDAP